MLIRPKPSNNLMGVICSLVNRMTFQQVLKKILAKQTVVTPKDKFAI